MISFFFPLSISISHPLICALSISSFLFLILQDWAERTEEQGLVIERILVLIRNVLQVPASPDVERRADNDASLHDQVIWSLHQAGILDLVLYIVCSDYENQYHLHALEIVCLLYREQVNFCQIFTRRLILFSVKLCRCERRQRELIWNEFLSTVRNVSGVCRTRCTTALSKHHLQIYVELQSTLCHVSFIYYHIRTPSTVSLCQHKQPSTFANTSKISRCL